MSMKKEKHIVFYIGSLGCGGAERVVTNLAAYMQSCGYCVAIVTKEQAEREYAVPSGVRRIHADICGKEVSKNRIKNFFRRLGKLRRIWKKEQPDIIVSFIRKNNFMAIASSLFMPCKVVVCVRSAPEREYGTKVTRFLARTLFGIADGVVLQTKQAFSFFPRRIQRKSVLLHNPLSTAFIRDVYAGERKKEVVAVGRIDANKNQIMLVRAFESIAREFPDWTCLIYGDGDGKQQILEYMAEKQIDKQIKLMGQVTDVPNKIGDAAIFVLPSKMEGMPNALIEAMALGLAVISTDCPCGGPADLIQNMENGILIPVEDEEALALALRRLMQDEALREKLGKNAAQMQKMAAPEKVNEEWREYLLSKM